MSEENTSIYPFPISSHSQDSLQVERDSSTLSGSDIEQLQTLIYGSQEKYLRRVEVMRLASQESSFSKEKDHYLDRKDLFLHFLEKAKVLMGKVIEWKVDMDLAQELFLSLGGEVPIALHQAMFIPTIESQGTLEQKREWLPKAQLFQIIGCYAQTEMGHGSNVQGLETEAIYDAETDSFILNTSHLSAMKWWPGGLGKTATHAIVHSRIIINNTFHGIHGLIVCIRDERHRPCSGILVGDIGPKFGYNSQDNGYLGFKNVKVPRKNLLSKYLSVGEGGKVKTLPKEFSRLGYLTMIQIRSRLVSDAYRTLAKACTIAIRYSIVRKQFTLKTKSHKSNNSEVCILTYPSQQYRLFTLLSSCYALNICGQSMSSKTKEYKQYFMRNQIDSGETEKLSSILSELHSTSAGLKALATWITLDGIERARKCCGGHGYHRLSGFYTLYNEYLPTCTYEGDNNILCLQVAHYLLKQKKRVTLDSNVYDLFEQSYLDWLKPLSSKKNKDKISYYNICNSEPFFDLNFYLDIFGKRNNFLLSEISKRLNPFENQMIHLAKCHSFYVIVKMFIEKIQSFTLSEDIKLSSDSFIFALELLCLLFCFDHFQDTLGDFLSFGILRGPIHEFIPFVQHSLLERIRPNALTLIEAFNYNDWELDSVLGCKDGKVYQRLWLQSQKEPLNTQITAEDMHQRLDDIKSGNIFLNAMQRRNQNHKL
jgi:acyl-CoA oxidase